MLWTAMATLTVSAAWIGVVLLTSELQFWNAVFPGAGFDRKLGLVVIGGLALTSGLGLAVALNRPRSAVIGTWLGAVVTFLFSRIALGYLQPSPTLSYSSDALVAITLIPVVAGAWLGLSWSNIFGRAR